MQNSDQIVATLRSRFRPFYAGFLHTGDWATDGSIADLTGQRSDTIMVVHVPENRENIYVNVDHA
ncbi:hypothetical protein [Cryobacterium shii]|uniref:Uncharacterized protein n=1 Tax=Cryobacterium shii TaxID=1259235 RepID=A0AAQ2C7G3_9MICO|nr:hypothetical protein [Cryobacterium shii]TFC49995.1 hypothetical protein E3O49_05570 [Cryobacterium shii]